MLVFEGKGALEDNTVRTNQSDDRNGEYDLRGRRRLGKLPPVEVAWRR